MTNKVKTLSKSSSLLNKTPSKYVPIVKAVDEVKRLATFVVLEPQDEDMTTTDLHLDWYSEEEVEKACHSFNRYCMKANLLHMVETEAFEFIESYVTKSDMILGNTFVKKGSWLATCYFSDDEVWQGVVDGTFNGLSIQCLATTEPIEA